MEKENNKSVCLYHGSNVIVERPEVRVFGHYKDFGYGFYCTRFEKQAQKWALTKKGGHIVTIYNYSETDNLNVRIFPEISDEWLDFVVDCRMGKEHQYDIVDGPMADDQIWDYVEDYVAGNISREAFWALARFKHPTHQVVFCTQEALKTLVYKAHYEI
ncbi:MAG: DUF3990 domain-containing protein [Prevotella sp.]|nr:DUF3990 domain-containing protein [Prevotella sp.]